jgi:hypothetical protein
MVNEGTKRRNAEYFYVLKWKVGFQFDFLGWYPL